MKSDAKSLVSLEGKVDQLNREVKEHLGKMLQCLHEQERCVDGQTKLIERSIRENVAQKATYAEMVKGTCSEVVDRVSAKLSAYPQLAASHTAAKDVQVFDDFLSKDRGKNNLVFHNLPESEATSLAGRSEHDTKLLQEFVKEEFRLRVQVMKSFRAGKAIPGRHRLLIVTMENEEVKHDLLRLAPQLRSSSVWGNIFISPDLTKAERDAARKLREELKARKQAGEDGLVIRKGRIVSAASSGSKAKPIEVGQHDDSASKNQSTRVIVETSNHDDGDADPTVSQNSDAGQAGDHTKMSQA